MLATQNLRDAVRQVLSSCSLPLDYVDTVAAFCLPHAHSGLSQSAGVSDKDQFSRSMYSTIVERFYGFTSHGQPDDRLHRMARNTLR